MSQPLIPQEISLNKQGDTLTVVFEQMRYPLSAEYLRVCSPSAEVRAHGGQWNILAGKEDVTIKQIVPIGNYAVRLVFSDGHDSGLYSWDILHDLAQNHRHYWVRYLTELKNKQQDKL